MIPNSGAPAGAASGGSLVAAGHWKSRPEFTKGRVLVVEDDDLIRDSLGPLLEEEGYEVSFAEDGREAMRRLHTEVIPDIIVLDLRMPVMDGWEFIAIQKDDPRLGLIPIVAMSADGTAKAAAICAQAFLRKPVGSKQLLATVARILFESRWQKSARLNETERLASLGRLAAGVGHEINNPLAFVMMNVRQSIETLEPLTRAFDAPSRAPVPRVEVEEMRVRVGSVADMLQDCEVGCERIRETVGNLQRLSRQSQKGERESGPVDIHKVIEESVSIAWNQIRHRARLIRSFGKVPSIRGNPAALGQVFLNILINAAQAIPEGQAERNEIRILTKVDAGENGAEIVVEISDSGKGIAPESVSHVFEPFFTTKAVGQGTGLGLSVSRQTVSEHGGRITVESGQAKGTVFRVFLPIGPRLGDVPEQPRAVVAPADQAALPRGRVLVIDDEPLIGRSIRRALSSEHDVSFVQRASQALARLEEGETFDLVLCDVAMPDFSGPAFYAAVAERWPELAPRLVFITGGAFTPETTEFMERVPTRVVSKPFAIDELKQLVREYLRTNT